MRVILGMILGVALAVLGAYAVDHSGGTASARPMVNWDVVADHWSDVRAGLRDWSADVRRGWHRLVG